MYTLIKDFKLMLLEMFHGFFKILKEHNNFQHLIFNNSVLSSKEQITF